MTASTHDFRVGLAVIADGKLGAITKVTGDHIRVLHDNGTDEWYDASSVEHAEAEDDEEVAMCQVDGCQEQATHRSGWGNGYSLDCCVAHTNERENDGAWSRSIA